MNRSIAFPERTAEEVVRAWLGPVGSQTCERDVQAIVAAWERIDQVYARTDGDRQADVDVEEPVPAGAEADDGPHYFPVFRSVPGAGEAMDGAGMWILGDITVEEALRDWQEACRRLAQAESGGSAGSVGPARRRAVQAEDQVRGVMIAAQMNGEGVAQAAQKAGLDRATLDRWIGR